ncbi:MAG: glycosyl hydrolase family 18 protein [Candidatus Dojkabacteria bacterium]
MKHKIILGALFLAIFLVSFGHVFLLLDQEKESSAESESNSAKQTESVIETEDPSSSQTMGVVSEDFTYSAWIPDWGSSAGLESLERNPNTLDTISPVWYEINEDGSLRDKRPNNWEQIRDFAIIEQIELVPAIAMFDHELFSKVLQNEQSLSRHIEQIHTEVVSNNYAGIDLDYESTKLEDKEKFFELLERLDTRLENDKKTLIFTVLPKWGTEEYNSLKETRQVQDWERIAEYADYIRIMAYDYTYSLSPKPGPIAPLNWMEQVLDYAVERVPREQLILGIHLYSYEWWCDLSDTDCELEFTPIAFANVGAGKRARSYTYSTVLTVLNKFGSNISEFDGEQIYRYEKDGEERMLVFIDPAGVQTRVDLAKEYRIKGVSFWRLGGEQDLLDGLE